MSRDLTSPRGQRATWNHGWVSIIIRNYPAKFCGHRPCRRRYILLLIGHATSHDHVINGFCGIHGSVSHPKSTPCKSYIICISRYLYICIDLWHVFLTNWLKRAFWLQTQACTPNLELQKVPYGIEALYKW